MQAIAQTIIPLFLILGLASTGRGDIFDLRHLPTGKSVTLVTAARTKLALNSRVILSATDSPQTVSFGLEGPSKAPIKLGIYDRHQERVQYIKLQGGKHFWYPFKGLSSILVIAENTSAKTDHGAYILIKSDKPLTLSP
ncbi:MAG: hypothetical protein HYW48_04745 [Deltaproteobacteria bacterium]|nr:hypothetical protein [Deltaproteobacteria bacterium]